MKPNLAELRALATAADALPRFADVPGPELRAAPDGSDSPGGVRYYAAVYNMLSVDMGGWRERIAPSAFDESLAEDDIRAMVNHDRAKVIARRSIEEGIDTLRLSSDDTGVLFEVDELPNTTAARDLVEDLRVKNITGASFGFRTVEDAWDWEGTAEDGIYVRTVLKARMFEGSPVSFPAYPDTMAEARSLFAAVAQVRTGREVSDELRHAVDQLVAAIAPAPVSDDESTRSDEPADDTPSWLDIARLRLRAHELADHTTTP